jgi:hypothetical protein
VSTFKIKLTFFPSACYVGNLGNSSINFVNRADGDFTGSTAFLPAGTTVRHPCTFLNPMAKTAKDEVLTANVGSVSCLADEADDDPLKGAPFFACRKNAPCGKFLLPPNLKDFESINIRFLLERTTPHCVDHPGGSKCYIVLPKSSKDSAMKECTKLGGKLPSIADSLDVVYLKDVFEKEGNGKFEAS